MEIKFLIGPRGRRHFSRIIVIVEFIADQYDTWSLPPATKLGQGYVFTGICDSVHGGGVPDQVHPRDQVHPPD